MASEKDFTYKEFRQIVYNSLEKDYNGNYSWDEEFARRRYEEKLEQYLAGDFSLQVFKAGGCCIRSLLYVYDVVAL